ncbi:fructokinase [Kitasatospora sp. MAA4]|uniref:carbohydrate kinase family protein n=1 Tax=Kitasatospora sp. MAA4 TaxID=3035093 RepID=UPI0024747B07|nr:carbohydrate kinase [Kitasatospora sp. MAA4]MDH6134450.1 fructokinase [Kitasatospora sp. MAA4]
MSITVLGECVADAFVQPGAPGELGLRVLPGGGPANTATALARLGTRTRLLARLSTDPFGALFRERLTAAGVDLADCPAAAEPSTLAIAALDPQGRAGYSFHAEGTADWQWQPSELAAVDLTGTHAVHTGSLALVRAPGGQVVEEFLARAGAHATISIDPNLRPLLVDPERYRERIARWCALADVLRLSADDLALLSPGTDPEQACDTWHMQGVRLVVLTLGEDGALASLDGERVRVPAVRTRVVDTVGAGDAFTGGLLHHLERRGLLGGRLTGPTLDQVAEACRFAAAVAALTCAVAGAEPPGADQLPPLD